MPHSGGGGSHSGGGGGSHSSGGGGSHSGGRTYNTSKTPFKGSKPYVVYGSNGRHKVIYTDAPHYREEFTKGQLIFSIMFSIPFIVPGFTVLIWALYSLLSSITFGLYKTPIPQNIDSQIVIMDDYDRLSFSEEESLKQVLTEFRDRTGVIPSIEITEDFAWYDDFYGNTEQFAYDEYVNNFYDENHLLIVYSFSTENEVTGFNEFYWHTMWGDDLNRTIKPNDEEFLADELQKEFSRANGQNVSIAIENAVKSLKYRLENRKITVDGMAIPAGFMIIWGFFFLMGGIGMLTSSFEQYKKGKDKITIKIEGEPVLLKCEYCGVSYYKGTIGTCLSCGAPLEN